MRRLLSLDYVLPIAIAVLGCASRFLFIWYPKGVVFDEVHFGKFVSAYFSGAYYFDIHPPLGKLLVALTAYLGGYRGGFPFQEIGEVYGNVPYIALRFLPNLAGGLIPLAVYLFLRTMGASRLTAGITGMLLLLENALLVQSHFILVDAFLILFGFFGLASFFWSKKCGYEWKRLILASVFLGLSLSIKWTGLGFLGLAFLVFLSDGIARRLFGWQYFAKLLLIFLLIPLALYLSIFFVHFRLLSKSGPGDAFMSQAFLSGNESFLQKVVELNKAMYEANATLSATHPYASRFYSWPFMIRPVFYWIDRFPDGTTGRIYFLGNPVIWWLSTFGLLVALFYWRPNDRNLKAWLYGGYLMSWLPFAFIGRVLFLYHYLIPLIFAISIFSFWFSSILENVGGRRKMAMIGGLFLLAFLAFLFFAPLSYGLPLSDDAYRLRAWLPTWM